jgi:hypothetical protein
VCIKLIEIGAAGADADPVTDITAYCHRRPKSGYFFKSLRLRGEVALDPSRFAACAYPASYGSSGRRTYIVSEENTLYWKDLGRPGPPDDFPRHPIKEGWRELQ